MSERLLRAAELDELCASGRWYRRALRTQLDLAIAPEATPWARGLANRERGCCSFFSFEFDAVDGDVVMYIGVSRQPRSRPGCTTDARGRGNRSGAVTSTTGLRRGELAASAGVNIQTLRYYERRGLLREPDRSVGGHRRYTPEALTTLRVMKAAQRLGFTLNEVADLLKVTNIGPSGAAMQVWRREQRPSWPKSTRS